MLRIILILLALTSAIGCRQSPQTGAAEQPARPGAIPEDWWPDVAIALTRIPTPKGATVFAVREDAREADASEIAFSLYEDGPDAAHRLGTYKLRRDGSLYELNDFPDDQRDMWVPMADE